MRTPSPRRAHLQPPLTTTTCTPSHSPWHQAPQHDCLECLLNTQISAVYFCVTTWTCWKQSPADDEDYDTIAHPENDKSGVPPPHTHAPVIFQAVYCQDHHRRWIHWVCFGMLNGEENWHVVSCGVDSVSPLRFQFCCLHCGLPATPPRVCTTEPRQG